MQCFLSAISKFWEKWKCLFATFLLMWSTWFNVVQLSQCYSWHDQHGSQFAAWFNMVKGVSKVVNVAKWPCWEDHNHKTLSKVSAISHFWQYLVGLVLLTWSRDHIDHFGNHFDHVEPCCELETKGVPNVVNVVTWPHWLLWEPLLPCWAMLQTGNHVDHVWNHIH